MQKEIKKRESNPLTLLELLFPFSQSTLLLHRFHRISCQLYVFNIPTHSHPPNLQVLILTHHDNNPQTIIISPCLVIPLLYTIFYIVCMSHSFSIYSIYVFSIAHSCHEHSIWFLKKALIMQCAISLPRQRCRGLFFDLFGLVIYNQKIT